MLARGCEGMKVQPCDPIPVATGRFRAVENWFEAVFAARYRVPRTDRPVRVRLLLPRALPADDPG